VLDPPAFALTRAGPSASSGTSTGTGELACIHIVEGLERATLASCAGAGVVTAAPQPSLEMRGIGRIELVEVATAPVTLATAGHGTDAQITVWIQLSGSACIKQADRQAALGAGDLCILRSARPARAVLDAGRLMLANVPEAEVADRFPLWRAALGRRVATSGGAPAVFLDALRSLQRWRETLGDAGGDSFADAVVDLVGAVICFAVPDDSGCLRRSLEQREQVKRFARQHLGDPDLSIELIAAGVDLSPRQIHRLFANEPLSLMRWIWAQRLEHCHRELTRGEDARRSVSDIAFAWGFNDQAHFSRAFRRQFGMSPREARRRAAEAR